MPLAAAARKRYWPVENNPRTTAASRVPGDAGRCRGSWALPVLAPIRRKNPDTEPRVSRSTIERKTCLSTAVLVHYVKLPGLRSATPLESAEEDLRPIG